jgi:hypothetical protein
MANSTREPAANRTLRRIAAQATQACFAVELCPKVNRRLFVRSVGLPRDIGSMLGMIVYRPDALKSAI